MIPAEGFDPVNPLDSHLMASVFLAANPPAEDTIAVRAASRVATGLAVFFGGGLLAIAVGLYVDPPIDSATGAVSSAPFTVGPESATADERLGQASID